MYVVHINDLHMEKYNINDIPEDIADMIRMEVRSREKYQDIVKKRNQLILYRRYVEATDLSARLKDMEDKALYAWLEYAANQAVPMNDLIGSMSEEDKENMASYCNAFIMVSDILETLIMDAEQLIKRYHPGTDFVMFDDLNKTAKKGSAMVRLLDQYKDDEFYMNNYGDMTDNLYEMVTNKARSFYRKIKRHEESVNKKKKKSA